MTTEKARRDLEEIEASNAHDPEHMAELADFLGGYVLRVSAVPSN